MNEGASIAVWFGLVFWWCVAIGLAVALFRALSRFVKAQERIASALESIAAKQ